MNHLPEVLPPPGRLCGSCRDGVGVGVGSGSTLGTCPTGSPIIIVKCAGAAYAIPAAIPSIQSVPNSTLPACFLLAVIHMYSACPLYLFSACFFPYCGFLFCTASFSASLFWYVCFYCRTTSSSASLFWHVCFYWCLPVYPLYTLHSL